MVNNKEHTMSKVSQNELQIKKANILSLLERDDKAVARAVVRIYQRQTEDEQRVSETKHHNKIGFKANDAKYLSMVARYVIANGAITEAYHLQKTRELIKHYWRQLIDIAEETNAKRLAQGKETVPLYGRQK
jgi:hypothetical protein